MENRNEFYQEYFINRFVGKCSTDQVFTLQAMQLKHGHETDQYMVKKFRDKLNFEHELSTIKDIKEKIKKKS